LLLEYKNKGKEEIEENIVDLEKRRTEKEKNIRRNERFNKITGGK
jgi:hypothetical protein